MISYSIDLNIRRSTILNNDRVKLPRQMHHSNRLNQPYHRRTNISVGSFVERHLFSLFLSVNRVINKFLQNEIDKSRLTSPFDVLTVT